MKRAAVEESKKREELGKKLEDKIKEMEEEVKQRQTEKRERKRNNVVISGLKEGKWDKAKVEEWLGEKLGISVKVKRTWVIRGKAKSKIGVECENREEKEKIMEEKSKLKGTDCFIDHNLTWQERRNKERLNGLAREWRSEGKPVKVRRNKLTVGDTTYFWNEREDRLFREGEARWR